MFNCMYNVTRTWYNIKLISYTTIKFFLLFVRLNFNLILFVVLCIKLQNIRIYTFFKSVVIDCSNFILYDALLVGTLKTFKIFIIRSLLYFYTIIIHLSFCYINNAL